MLSATCTSGRAAIVRALVRAPAPVTLDGRMRLSQCVADAQDPGAQQEFGLLVVGVADTLAEPARRDAAAAVRLGYLIGATRRGAAGTNGVMLELVRRVEAAARRQSVGATPATRAALARGMRAGERDG